MNQNQKITQSLYIVLSLITAFFAFSTPIPCKEALLEGISLCTNTLFFALFPFFIVSHLLMQSGLAPIFGLPFRAFCRCSGIYAPCAGGIVALGFLGGFAPATNAIRDAVKHDMLTHDEAARLLPICCLLGPSFIILAVGEGLFHSQTLGLILFLSQAFACLATGLIMRVCAPHPQTQVNNQAHSIAAQQMDSLPTIITNAMSAFIKLCAILLYFRFLCAGCITLLPTHWAWAVYPIFEVTSGCQAIIAHGAHNVVFCCAAFSTLSISILLQIATLCPAGVSLKPLFFARLIHLPLSLLFLWALLPVMRAQTVYNSLSDRVLVFQRTHTDQALLIFIVCVVAAHTAQQSLQRRQNAL